MKKFLLLLYFVFGIALAQSPNEQFQKGNEAYADGNYKEAVRQYSQLLKDDWQSPELHFNLGNTYYKQGEIAPSIYHYEMALLLAPGNKTFQNNLQFAEQKRIDQLAPVQISEFDMQVQKIINFFNLQQWSIIIVSLAFASLAFFIGFLFLKKTFYKRLFFNLFILSTLVAIVAYYIADKQSFLSNENTFGIIFSEEVNVLSEPNGSSNTLFVLHEGTKVQVEDEFRNFTKIQFGDNTTGWIETTHIRKIQQKN